MEHRSSSALCPCPCPLGSCSPCFRLRMKLRESWGWLSLPGQPHSARRQHCLFPGCCSRLTTHLFPCMTSASVCFVNMSGPLAISNFPQTPITFTFLLHFEPVWHWLSSFLGLLLYLLHCSARYFVLPVFHSSHLPSS